MTKDGNKITIWLAYYQDEFPAKDEDIAPFEEFEDEEFQQAAAYRIGRTA